MTHGGGRSRAVIDGGEPWQILARHRPGLDLNTLESYARELERWNRAIRLVGPKDLSGIRLQIADALLPFLLFPPGFPLLDIGSGAGLPGIPIAIAGGPEGGARVVCLEPRAKRVSFLHHIVRVLELKDIRVVAGRAEDAVWAEPGLSGEFATVTARAVADAGSLLRLAGPFVAPSGRVIVPRGPESAPTVEGWQVIQDEGYEGPPGVGPRRLAVYVKREG